MSKFTGILTVILLAASLAVKAYAGPELKDVTGLDRAENCIVYDAGNTIKLITLDGKYYADFQCEGYSPVFSPNGRRIAFVSRRDGNEEIYIMNADGSDQKRLTNNKAWDEVPAFSPDGSTIAFMSTRYGNSGQIFTMDVDGSSQKRLTSGGCYNDKPAFSPDGSKIIFTANDSGYSDAEIYAMNADGSNRELINPAPTADSLSPGAFSPDGIKIAFGGTVWVTETAGVTQVHVVNVNGSGLKRLTFNDVVAWAPAFSPDGTKIAFTMADRIYLMKPDGSGQTPLTNDYSLNPAFSPMRVNGVLYDTYGHVIKE